MIRGKKSRGSHPVKIKKLTENGVPENGGLFLWSWSQHCCMMLIIWSHSWGFRSAIICTQGLFPCDTCKITVVILHPGTTNHMSDARFLYWLKHALQIWSFLVSFSCFFHSILSLFTTLTAQLKGFLSHLILFNVNQKYICSKKLFFQLIINRRLTCIKLNAFK